MIYEEGSEYAIGIYLGPISPIYFYAGINVFIKGKQLSIHNINLKYNDSYENYKMGDLVKITVYDSSFSYTMEKL